MKHRFLLMTLGMLFEILLVLPAQAQQFVNILTGGASGVYYPMGVVLSQIFAKSDAGKHRCRLPRRRGEPRSFCIAVAAALQTVIPATLFTLAWTHSKEKER